MGFVMCLYSCHVALWLTVGLLLQVTILWGGALNPTNMQRHLVGHCSDCRSRGDMTAGRRHLLAKHVAC